MTTSTRIMTPEDLPSPDHGYRPDLPFNDGLYLPDPLIQFAEMFVDLSEKEKDNLIAWVASLSE